MTHTTTVQPRRTQPPVEAGPRHAAARAVVGIPVGLTVLVSIVLLAFGLPAVGAQPHDLPVGIAGPAAVVQPLAEGLAQREPGAFAVQPYDGEVSLTRAIQDREVYGGVAITPQGPVVLTASAASPVVAQALSALAAHLPTAPGAAAAEVRDVVPLPADDPRGAGLAAGMLPLVLGGILPAVALAHVARRRRHQLAGLAAYAVVGGLGLAAVLHQVFGTLSGNYLAEAAAVAATVGAAALALLGLARVAGRIGLALGAATLVLLGNPLSGASTAPEFLVSPWRELGQAMPPGAGSQLLRSVSFFDGAASTGPLLVLGGWAVAGLLLLAVPRRTGDSAG